MSTGGKGSLYALVSALGFSSMPIFANMAYQAGASVETVLTGRFLFAALFVWAIVGYRRMPVRIGWRLAGLSFLLGVLGYAVMSYSYFTALTYISASLTAMLLYLYPMFVTVFALLLRQETWDLRKGVALAASLVGLGLMVGLSLGHISGVGVAYGAAAGIVYSVFILANRQIGSKVPVLTMTAYIISGAFFSLLLAGLTKGTLQVALPLTATGSIAVIALFSTAMAIALFTASIQYIGASKASIISTLEPLFTMIMAYLFLHETMTFSQLFGAGLILLALFVLQLPMHHDKRSSLGQSL